MIRCIRGISGIVAAVVLAALVVSPVFAQRGTRILLFPINGADGKHAADLTQAVKATLRQGNTLQVVDFRPDLPTLRRALMENQVTRADLESADVGARRKIARALEADYFIGGKSSVPESGGMTLTLTAVQTASGRSGDFEAQMGPSGSGAPGDQTLVLSVANTAVTRFMSEMLNALPPAAPMINLPPVPPVRGTETPSTDEPEDSGDPESPPAAPQPTPPTPPSPQPNVSLEAASYRAQAEALAASGDLAGAIQAMRSAVNIAPTDVSLRIKLASYYTRRGMTQEAASELQRAVAMAPATGDSRQDLAKEFEALGSPAEARRIYEQILAENPADSDARLALGDVLWNLGQPDQAAREYERAAADSPSDAEPHERLARLYASEGKFLDALTSLYKIRSLRNEPDTAPVERGLYRSLMQSSDVAYHKHRATLEKSGRDFNTQEISREQYFQSVKSVLTEVEGLADFLTDLTPPPEFMKPHLHRTLAASLLSQAVTTLQDWLIRGDDVAKAESQRFMRESQTESDTAASLERRLRSNT